MTALFESAPAKINLTLEILGRRADGYHELQSLVVFARDCADRVSLDMSKPEGIAVSGPFGGMIEGDNLLAKVLTLARETEPRLKLGAFELTKNLPVASGIGGGSADAAAALRLIRRANPELAAGVDWKGLAARLGADVPVCLEGLPALMSGIGEIIEPVAVLPRMTAVLINPQAKVPVEKTARVFRHLAAPALSASPNRAEAPALAGLDAVLDYMASHRNGLTAAAMQVVPEIAGVLEALDEMDGCRVTRLSGAGPTCFAIFESSDAAEEAQAVLAETHPQWWVTRSRLG